MGIFLLFQILINLFLYIVTEKIYLILASLLNDDQYGFL